MEVRFGEYERDGLQFTYHVSFKEMAGNITWRAIVRDHAGALVATPKGMLSPAEADSLEERLRNEVVKAIGMRAGQPPGSPAT
jgi:hypothetical protein